MRHQQQVMCQRFALSLRVLSQVLRMTQEARDPNVGSDLPTLDATEQTMSDRSDSHFIQRPSSTHTRRWRFSGPVTDVLCKLPFAEFFEKNRIRCKRSLPDFY
jgi:hypothetical protein